MYFILAITWIILSVKSSLKLATLDLFLYPMPSSHRHLSSELLEHEKLIDKMVSADFTKYITEDLNRPLNDTHPLLEEVREQWGISGQGKKARNEIGCALGEQEKVTARNELRGGLK